MVSKFGHILILLLVLILLYTTQRALQADFIKDLKMGRLSMVILRGGRQEVQSEWTAWGWKQEVGVSQGKDHTPRHGASSSN